MRGFFLLSLLAIFAVLDQSCEGCARDKFMCQTSECIFESFVCDGHEDCSNGKDEGSCGNDCPVHHFRCSNGSCIVNTKICDGLPDCKDGDDESSCGDECYSVEFKCSNGHCIPGHRLRCDGKNDCTDGSDEEGCDNGRPCSQQEFTCSNGTCIQRDWLCDGDKDCPDGGDEKNCSESLLPPKISLTATCSSQEVTCPDGSCRSGIFGCFYGLDTTTLPTSNITALSISSNTTKSKDDNQQCLLGEGCLIKVMAVVFGVMAVLAVLFGGSFCLRYRNKVSAGESPYLPLSRQRESNTSNEAFTMEDVP